MRKKKYILISTSILMGFSSLNICADRVSLEQMKNGNINLSNKMIRKKWSNDGVMKGFNKNAYIEDDYTLEVTQISSENYNVKEFEDQTVLLYTHKKTGAQVVVYLFDDEKFLSRVRDELFFVSFVTKPNGINHIFEHFFVSKNFFAQLSNTVGSIKNKGSSVNSTTTPQSVSHEMLASEKERNKDIFRLYFIDTFKNPYIKTKGAEEFYENEIHGTVRFGGKIFNKGRLFNEVVSDEEKEKLKSAKEFLDYVDYNPFEFLAAGRPEYIKKVKIEDARKAYDKVIHPSNCLMVLNVLKSPKKVKGYLKQLSSWFNMYEKRKYDNLKDFEEQKKYIDKKTERNKFIKTYKDSRFLRKNSYAPVTPQNKAVKYKCFFHVLKNQNLNEVGNSYFEDIDENVLENLFSEEIKKMGYENVFLINRAKYLGFTVLGNKREPFERSVLEKNCMSLVEKLVKKVKEMPKDQYDKVFCSFNKKENDSMPKEEKLIQAIELVNRKFLKAFSFYGNLKDERVFSIEGNKIEIGEDRLRKDIVKNINNIDFLLKLIKESKDKDKTYTLYEMVDKVYHSECEGKHLDEMALKVYYDNFTDEDLKKERVLRLLLEIIMKNKLDYEKGFMYGGAMSKGYQEEEYLEYCNLEDNAKELVKKFHELSFNDFIKNYKMDKEKYSKFFVDYVKTLEDQIKEYEEIINCNKELLKKVEQNSKKLTKEEVFRVDEVLKRVRSAIIGMLYLRNRGQSKEMEDFIKKEKQTLVKYGFFDLYKNDKKDSKYEKSLENLTKFFNKKYRLIKEVANKMLEFNKKCIQDLTGADGKVKPYDYDEIMKKINNIRYKSCEKLTHNKSCEKLTHKENKKQKN